MTLERELDAMERIGRLGQELAECREECERLDKVWRLTIKDRDERREELAAAQAREREYSATLSGIRCVWRELYEMLDQGASVYDDPVYSLMQKMTNKLKRAPRGK